MRYLQPIGLKLKFARICISCDNAILWWHTLEAMMEPESGDRNSVIKWRSPKTLDCQENIKRFIAFRWNLNLKSFHLFWVYKSHFCLFISTCLSVKTSELNICLEWICLKSVNDIGILIFIKYQISWSVSANHIYMLII